MRDTMTARGPDEAGLCQRNNFLFAHRRLAIRDLEGGKQPWVSSDGRFLLVYNGEIYNDDQLRSELEQTGVRFRTAQRYRSSDGGLDQVGHFVSQPAPRDVRVLHRRCD